MAKKILAVDDSKTMREMITFVLRNAGFDVSEAEDGRAALDLLSAGGIDLVITDLNMPVMDGIDFIKKVRADERFKKTPVLVLTTETDPSKKSEGRAAGATGWLGKPFNPTRLVEVVNQICA